MTLQLVGYKLVNKQGSSMQEWGGTLGQTPAIPNQIVLPSKMVQVYCAEVGGTYEDIDGQTYTLIEWKMEDGA